MDESGERQILDLTERLVRDVEGEVPAGVVIRLVLSCRDALVQAGVTAGLTTAVEAMARVRLRHSAALACLPQQHSAGLAEPRRRPGLTPPPVRPGACGGSAVGPAGGPRSLSRSA